MYVEVKQRAVDAWAKRPSLLRGRTLWIAGAVLVVLVFVIWNLFKGDSNAEPYRTTPIDRGAITRVVSATGTLQPVISANVGSTVSGPVKEVLVDFNAQVHAGQVLARLDPSQFQARVIQAQATLAQAQAQLAVANADYSRYALLNQRGFASAQLMSQQRAARDTARAAVASAQAQVSSAQTDLSRSVITAPISGTIVDRQVNVGQSVAASLQAPTLFIIAQDLSNLQANITVDEADIGDVREGQNVRFTVDAFPDRDFQGRVAQVRQQGASDQGVVTYTVVVTAPNPDHSLLPGMTANAEIVLEERDNVLRVPNTALRFTPADEQLAARGRALAGQGGGRGQGANNAQGGGGQGGAGQGRGQRGVAQLTQALELTPPQQETARTAFQAAMALMPRGAGGGGDQSASAGGGGARRAAMRQIREQVIRALEPSLSDHQRQLLTQMRATQGQRREVRTQAVVWVLRNNRPEPVQVELGIADNTYTLVYSGLNAGDQVITGGGPRPKTQARPGGGLLPGGGGGGGGGGRPGGGVRGA